VETRERVVHAAADLLISGGRDAVSTRAVSTAAGIQAPTLYRLFGDKDGLLDAVAAHGFAEYLERKKELTPTDDPVEDLRRGWDLNVEFGLSRPQFYLLMFGDNQRAKASETGRAAAAILEAIVMRIAAAGRLRMSVARAVQVNQAMCTGVALSLIEADEPDLGLSAVVREAALLATVTGLPEPVETVGVASRAVALRAALPPVGDVPLSPGEHVLLTEWLDRLADHIG
jgi:AcrR family transcriptional regulator